MKKPGQAVRLSPALIAPAGFWLVFFLLVPLCFIGVYSFCLRGDYGGIEFHASLANYQRAFDWIYLRIFAQSLKLALFTSGACLLIGYPMAFLIATVSRAWRSLLLIAVVLPFWTNFVVRTYAIKAAFAPFEFTGTFNAIAFGMVTNYLPFMVLPLYVALEKFDFTLLEAASDLGASRWTSFWRVLMPLTLPGIATGLVFVFAPALGEFVIPDLLGGARTMLIGNLISEQFLKSRDWPFGSALAMMLISAVVLSLLSARALKAARTSV